MNINLVKLITSSAIKHKDKIAIKIKDQCITYEELLFKAKQLAVVLIENGVEREPIGLVGQRHVSSYIGILGILLAGCYYVPINPKLNGRTLKSILDDSKIRILVGDKDSICSIDYLLQPGGYTHIQKKIIPVGKSTSKNGWIDEDYLKNINNLDYIDRIHKSNLAYVMYTSGSTGHPKGVQVTSTNVVTLINNMNRMYDLAPGFVASQSHDLNFDVSVSDIFNTWANGGVLCVLPEEEKLYPADFIVRESIEFWSAVPTLLKFMEGIGGLKDNCFDSIRNTIFCGEPLPIELVNHWIKAAPNSSIHNLYGPTEATVFITKFKIDNQLTGMTGYTPIGKPFDGHRVEIIDNNGNRQSSGFEGELVLSGPQITNGYLNDQEKTKASFINFNWDPSYSIWYKSGDLGFYNELGELEYIGRKDNQVKIGGRRVEIGEIEASLSNLSLLKDIVVVPIRDENKTVVDFAAFTTNNISKEDLNNIRKESQKLIDRIFFPKKIITLDEFPYLPSGKVDRNALSLRLQSKI